MPGKKYYEYVDHTADLGIKVYGKTPEALFINIGRAIFKTQIRGTIILQKTIEISIESESIEDLFIDWCRELLFKFSTQGFVPKEYNVSIRNSVLRAKLKGDIFDQRRHKVRIEIKNPTYHNFYLKKGPKGYKALIIFDV